MTILTSERTFEDSIEFELAQGGYIVGKADEYDNEKALFPRYLFAFIEEADDARWERLKKRFGENLEKQMLSEIESQRKLEGSLGILRQGFKFMGERIQVAQFRPAHKKNQKLWKLYSQNKLVVTRQIKFNPGHPHTVDMVVSLNGFPVATMELKSPTSGQKVVDAKVQYRNRDWHAPLFAFSTGAPVHFAVDTDEVYMTTKLQGKDTKFLPFNKGCEEGKGNPPNPSGGYKTSYLWEEVLSPESLLEIVGSFMHVIREHGRKTLDVGVLLFPRYHQLDVVREIVRSVRENGVGGNKLVQHSAGSGKTASIAWLAHQLAVLHNEKDQKYFRSVIVVSDRTHLDQNLQDAIHQIERDESYGMVEAITKTSKQLSKALQEGKKIIISTLHKFPFADLVDELDNVKGNYAVIIDEAHRSQAGELTRSLKETLSAGSLDEAERLEADTDVDDWQDELNRIMESRGLQDNISFFAFTATPKPKTLQMFGEMPEGDRRGSGALSSASGAKPFHLYSTRQAIEEGFIIDVLQSYTTLRSYIKLIKTAQGDPKLPKRKGSQALGRFIGGHQHNIEERVKVMVEHFTQSVRHEIGGQAKAMVLTPSRLHAVRYYLAMKEHIAKEGYNIPILVAFSGKVVDPETGKTYTEEDMNGFSEAELPAKFKDSRKGYRILIVANKYQTGFDEPLLHTMYVDKKLRDTNAVQALSRLNRVHPGKDNVFVLDFVNDAADIQDAFRPYFETTILGEALDHNTLYALQKDIQSYHVIWPQEVERFASIFYGKGSVRKTRMSKREIQALQGKLNGLIDQAVYRFKNLEEGDQEDFRTKLREFVKIYEYLSHVIPFKDEEMEKLYSYGRLLLKKLPDRMGLAVPDLSDTVELQYYRLQVLKKDEDLRLGTTEGPGVVDDQGVGKGGGTLDEKEALSKLIESLNDKFGTNFTEAELLYIESLTHVVENDEIVIKSANANDDIGNFLLRLLDRAEDLLVEQGDKNQEIMTNLLSERELFEEIIQKYIGPRVYRKARGIKSS